MGFASRCRRRRSAPFQCCFHPSSSKVVRSRGCLCRSVARALDASCGELELVIANAGVGDQMSAEKVEWSRVRQARHVNERYGRSA
jgi:hypothetical protein